MTRRVYNAIRKARENLTSEHFNQWLLEQLVVDINNKKLDERRLEILRFIATEGLLNR